MQKVWAKQTGFTIVELLIVVIVIAILAAITIVSYNGITKQANDSAVQSDLTSVSKQFMMYRTEKGDLPKGSTQLATLDIRLSKGAYDRGMYNGTDWYNVVYCWPNTADPETFAIVAKSKSGAVFQAKNGSVTKLGLLWITAITATGFTTMMRGRHT